MAAKRKPKRKLVIDAPPEAGLELVHEYDRRHYQQDFADARAGRTVAASGGLNSKGQFLGCNGWDRARGPCTKFLLAWHRRAGKDREGLETIRESMFDRVGAYWHLYPLQVQAKKAIWNGVDPATGTRLIDLVFEPSIVEATDNQDLFKRFKNGSTYQLIGSDNYNRNVGAGPVGLLVSEWALCDPAAYAYLAPMLAENGGWVAFISTYRGRNHMYQMVQKLRLDPQWYVDVRTIEMTRRANGERVISPERVEQDRATYVALYGQARADALIREEYFCDPMAALPGSVYGGSVARMLAEGRA